MASGLLHGSVSSGRKETLLTEFSFQVSEVLQDCLSRDACTLGGAVETMEWCDTRALYPPEESAKRSPLSQSRARTQVKGGAAPTAPNCNEE